MTRRPIQSEEEALRLLAERRAALVAKAYPVAVELARYTGSVYGQKVFREMERRGLLTEADKALPGNWMAVVFRGKLYKDPWRKRGEIKAGNAERNNHARTVGLWVLRDSEEPYEKRPTPGEIATMLDEMRDLLDTDMGQSPCFLKLGKWLRSQLQHGEG